MKSCGSDYDSLPGKVQVLWCVFNKQLIPIFCKSHSTFAPELSNNVNFPVPFKNYFLFYTLDVYYFLFMLWIMSQLNEIRRVLPKKQHLQSVEAAIVVVVVPPWSVDTSTTLRVAKSVPHSVGHFKYLVAGIIITLIVFALCQPSYILPVSYIFPFLFKSYFLYSSLS